MSAAETYDAPQGLPLHRLDAEQALLGAIIFSNELLERIGDLRAEHFYDPAHQSTFDAIKTLIGRGQVADAVTLRKFFLADAAMKQLGGVDYLATLVDAAAPLSSQAVSYAQLIIDLARRRGLCAIAEKAIEQLHTFDADDAADIAADMEAALLAASLGGDDKDAFVEKGHAAVEAVAEAERGKVKGLSTGFEEIDNMIGGLRPKLYLLGAASSMGKTTLASAIGRNVAAQGFGVVEFLLEMDEVEDGLRTAAALAFRKDHRAENPHYLTAQRGALNARQREALRAGAAAAVGLPILTDYRPGRTLSQIAASARRGLARLNRRGYPPGLVIIDHEGLIAHERGQRYPSQIEATNARAAHLIRLPDILGVPVLVTGQLTKEGKRADGDERLPSGDDWKYGGALIEAAHAVMLLHRPAFYAERKPEHLRSDADWDLLKSREATVIVDKARGGRRGRATLWMDVPTAAVWGERCIGD